MLSAFGMAIVHIAKQLHGRVSCLNSHYLNGDNEMVVDTVGMRGVKQENVYAQDWSRSVYAWITKLVRDPKP